MKIKKLVSSELKLYVINPKEFTQMSLSKRSQEKRKGQPKRT